MSVVAFDMLGTLFDLGELRERMPRVLHHATALTLAGEWAPFAEVVRGVDPELEPRLREVAPFDDARRALETVVANGDEPWILTNGGRDAAEGLLERGGLRELVAELHTTEEVRRYKPHPDVYGLLPRPATLVAAHAWDVVGATRAGYNGVWVNRIEQTWPFPWIHHHKEAPDLVAATFL